MTIYEVDVYRVGLFDDWHHHHRIGRRYVALQLRARNWRAVRNYFNGYLAEHPHCRHNAGRGWTRRAATRRVTRICLRCRRSPQ